MRHVGTIPEKRSFYPGLSWRDKKDGLL